MRQVPACLLFFFKWYITTSWRLGAGKKRSLVFLCVVCLGFFRWLFFLLSRILLIGSGFFDSCLTYFSFMLIWNLFISLSSIKAWRVWNRICIWIKFLFPNWMMLTIHRMHCSKICNLLHLKLGKVVQKKNTLNVGIHSGEQKQGHIQAIMQKPC